MIFFTVDFLTLTVKILHLIFSNDIYTVDLRKYTVKMLHLIFSYSYRKRSRPLKMLHLIFPNDIYFYTGRKKSRLLHIIFSNDIFTVVVREYTVKMLYSIFFILYSRAILPLSSMISF